MASSSLKKLFPCLRCAVLVVDSLRAAKTCDSCVTQFTVATPTQLDFSSPVVDGGGDYSDDTSPSFSRRRKPPRKPASKRAASETLTEEETKKKKKKKVRNNNNNNKLASPMSNRIWNEEDELAILKGLVDYRAKTGFETKIDWDAFYRFVGGSIHVKVSKDQLSSKIRKLKKKFLLHMEKINQGNDPHFTRSSDSEAFGFSMMIWGQTDAEFANMDKAHQSETQEEMFKEDEVVALIGNGTAKSDFDDGNGTAGKENDGNKDDDELCAVQDAFETMMSQGLSDYQKKLHVKKLMNLGTEKRRELSNEWKALCVEESKLNIKKLRFSANLAEAAN
ncbi:GLABROUS1 enhancer-binding protein-like 2 [Capsella rubella]|uniref:GLABROUS1 enhancer-binding protein-like 2 n=1 Tax=Capsella rubella TaxID=81985 RepID=UPI000CD595D8|nr:GLABROUS1 enhancer-binding protein-like 2 [Capsella rubella]